MKKIVMLTCLKANRVCTGAACLQAFNSKTKTFARYQEPLELEAFFRCNGCDAQGIGVWDEGMEEKVERLLSLHTDAVHLGVCTKEKSGRRCPLIQRVADALSEAGAVIVDGTH